MKGMTNRTAYFFKADKYEPEMVYIPKNGNRIETARIIRPKPAPEPDPIQYRVSGWDKKTNTVRTVVDTMDEALDLGLNMLHARIKAVRRK